MMRLFVLSLWGLAVSAQILAPIVTSKLSCGAFAHCYTISYNHTLTGTADTSSYPALVYFSGTAMKDAGHGGDANSSAGADILFYSDAALSTQIPSELEYYDNVNGVGWFWVNISSLSHTVDGTIHLGIGTALPAARTAGVWDANYVAVWHFGTTSGKLADSRGTYTLTDNAAAGTGVAATQIDGGVAPVGDSVFSTAALTMGTTVTVECWENSSAASSNEMFVEKSPVNSSWELFHSGSGANALILRGNEAGGGTTTTFPASGWHYIVGTITGTSGAIYVDNSAAVTGTVTAAGNTNTAIHIGDYDATTTFAFNGSLDEVRVSNIVRSSSYVLATYNNTSAPGNIGSAGFWTWGARQ